MNNVIERVKRYAGQDFDKCRFGNPNITKRESIELANYISKLEHTNKPDCLWIYYDAGLMGFEDYEYKTQCGRTYSSDELPSVTYCPNCGGMIKHKE